MRKLLIILLLISYHHAAHSQIYDFDSLYEHSEDFQKVFNQIKDTFDIFNSTELMEIVITSDFKLLVKNKAKGEYQPAMLETIVFDTLKITRNIKIKARGNNRRQTCFHPPIFLNFPKKEAHFKQFEDFDKLKMVDYCKPGNIYEKYLFSEYYVYKLYNILTPYSFRVRLLKVKYIDSSGKKKPRTNYAFIIENVNQLAQRMNGIYFNREKISSRDVDAEYETLMSIFQFMIGNTDWSIPVLHNIKLVKVNDIKKPLPITIPYDFDYTGIVNTIYAIPIDELGIESVTERLFRGLCRDRSEYQKVFDLFLSKKEEIMNVYTESPYMDKNQVKYALSYLKEFYRIIESNASINNYIMGECR